FPGALPRVRLLDALRDDRRRHELIALDVVGNLDRMKAVGVAEVRGVRFASRSEEHTSELQSRFDLVCRLLLEKKKIANRRLHLLVPVLEVAVVAYALIAHLVKASHKEPRGRI